MYDSTNFSILSNIDEVAFCNRLHYRWDKVFKSGLSKFCGRQPLKNVPSPPLNFVSDD